MCDVESSSSSQDFSFSRGFDGSESIKLGSEWSHTGTWCWSHRFELFSGGNRLLKPLQANLTQATPLHYATVKFNNKRRGNDTWRPGFITHKGDAVGRCMYSLHVVSSLHCHYSHLWTNPSVEILRILQCPDPTASLWRLKAQKVWSWIILTDGEKSLTKMKHRELTSAAVLNANERLRSADLTVDDYLNHFICCFRRLPRQIYRREKQERLAFWRRERKTITPYPPDIVISMTSSVNMRVRVSTCLMSFWETLLSLSTDSDLCVTGHHGDDEVGSTLA